MLVPAAGVTIQNKYTLDAPLAQGGMGSVWIATHRELSVRVAVKFMAPELAASGGGARFEREAKAAAHLDSRHIVQIRDYGVVEGTPFLVMELLRGESLEQRLVRVRRVALSEAVAILRQLAKGLRKAHESGIIHRDLKPGNIFIARVDDEEVVKILDFGIAKVASATKDANATRTGMVMGSVHYASPEQLRSSKDADARSDIWSVGVILFRMVVGGLPFRGHEIADVIVKVCAEPIPAPRSMAPDLPEEVDEFFLRALARNPAERFQTISELVETFAALVERANGAIRYTSVVAEQTEPPMLLQGVPLPAMLSAPHGSPQVTRVPDGEASEKTALWSPAHPPAPVLPTTPDNTLRATGATSVTASPSTPSEGSRRLAFILAAVSVVVLGGVVVSAFLRLPSGQMEVAGASPPAANPSVEPAATSASTQAATSAAEPPALPRAALEIGSGPDPDSTAAPVASAASASPTQAKPPTGSTVATPTAPVRSDIASVPPAPPARKTPSSKTNDKDVEMP